jgi:hypothetical protein
MTAYGIFFNFITKQDLGSSTNYASSHYPIFPNYITILSLLSENNVNHEVPQLLLLFNHHLAQLHYSTHLALFHCSNLFTEIDMAG